MPNVSQVLNKVEVSVKITEMGFLFIKVHNLGCKKGKKKRTMEGFHKYCH